MISWERFFPKKGRSGKGKKILIHAVSLGEAKSALPLVKLFNRDFPGQIAVSSSTRTGLAFWKENFQEGEVEILAFPLDLFFSVRRFFSIHEWDCCIFIENDLWPFFLSEGKKRGCRMACVSAKLSLRSFKRWSYFPFFAKRHFNKLDLVLTQNDLHKERFSAFVAPEKVEAFGNLKMDLALKRLFAPSSLNFHAPAEQVITLASSHAGEEKVLLDLAQKRGFYLVIAPRHPSRFFQVEALIQKSGLSYQKASSCKKWTEQVMLVDAMGILDTFYKQSTFVVIGGTFAEEKIGGHNPLEPIVWGVPVLFGKDIEGQKELVDLILQEGAGAQFGSEKELEVLISGKSGQFEKKAKKLSLKLSGVVEKTFRKISLFFAGSLHEST